jgi:hypothetical protein
MNASQFIQKWQEYAEKYGQWYAPVKRFQDDYMKENDLNWGDYERINAAVLDFREAHKAKNDLPGEIYDFIDENLHVYLEASPEEQAAIRAVPANNRDFSQIVWGYIVRARLNLAETGEKDWLVQGVAMISIEDMAIDFRDTFLNLASLYVEAEKHGLKPQPVLNAVARASSQEKPKGGDTPMASTLRRFRSYAVLKEARRNAGLTP